MPVAFPPSVHKHTLLSHIKADGQFASEAGCVATGIANDKAVSVRPTAGDDVSVEVSKKSTKTGKTVVSVNKQAAGRVMAAVSKEVGDYRPDLKEEATTIAGVSAAAAARSGADAEAATA